MVVRALQERGFVHVGWAAGLLCAELIQKDRRSSGGARCCRPFLPPRTGILLVMSGSVDPVARAGPLTRRARSVRAPSRREPKGADCAETETRVLTWADGDTG